MVCVILYLQCTVPSPGLLTMERYFWWGTWGCMSTDHMSGNIFSVVTELPGGNIEGNFWDTLGRLMWALLGKLIGSTWHSYKIQLYPQNKSLTKSYLEELNGNFRGTTGKLRRHHRTTLTASKGNFGAPQGNCLLCLSPI